MQRRKFQRPWKTNGRYGQVVPCRHMMHMFTEKRNPVINYSPPWKSQDKNSNILIPTSPDLCIIVIDRKKTVTLLFNTSVTIFLRFYLWFDFPCTKPWSSKTRVPRRKMYRYPNNSSSSSDRVLKIFAVSSNILTTCSFDGTKSWLTQGHKWRVQMNSERHCRYRDR